VKRWARDAGRPGSAASDSYVVSRYIERPLLVGGKKFDLRMYVLVTSWRPLMAYRYKQGFARFCAVKYTSGDLGNTFVHLTNVAVQKRGRDYDETNGGKWNLSSFMLFIESTRGLAAARKLEEDIDLVFLLSLKACQNAVSNDPHCFEVYGFDIIVDEDLKPWLIEVNASPSLSANTESDRAMKSALIADTLAIVVPPDFPEPRGRGGVNVYPREDTDMGEYEILYDEAAEVDAERARRESEAAGRYGSGSTSAGRRGVFRR
jgi:tubulin polyglutamylase TTLL1